MPEIITASYLFAKEKYNPGNENCFYCGISCGTEYIKKEYVKQTFTNRDIVMYPGSDYVCGCCIESLITGYTTKLIDGEVKKGRSGTPRIYSWILTKNKNFAFSKKHIYFARENILNPPEPPFSIILADSGQKQIIFRATVNHDKNIFKILLEEKEIEVNPEILKKYLNIAILVSAAIGKIALKTPDEFLNYKNVIEYYGDEVPLVEWLEIYSSPLGELAAWLCPGKEEARNDRNVISRKLPEEACRTGRSVSEVTGDGRESNKNGSNQVLLDFA